MRRVLGGLMLRSGERKRARPGFRGLGLSVTVFVTALYLASRFPFQSFLEPLFAALGVGLIVSSLRIGGIRKGLPEPLGKGKVSTIDVRKAARSGMLVSLGGLATTMGLMGSVFVLPPEVFFLVVFGLMGGLPFSQILFFLMVYRLEWIGKGRVYTVTEESQEGGQMVLRKSVEIIPSP